MHKICCSKKYTEHGFWFETILSNDCSWKFTSSNRESVLLLEPNVTMIKSHNLLLYIIDAKTLFSVAIFFSEMRTRFCLFFADNKWCTLRDVIFLIYGKKIKKNISVFYLYNIFIFILLLFYFYKIAF